jgi:hypothetical protein
MLLTQRVLDAMSISVRYQHETFLCRGMRLELESPEKNWWVIPKANALARLSLATKRCTLPMELRRLRVESPPEAERVANGYARDLHALFQG